MSLIDLIPGVSQAKMIAGAAGLAVLAVPVVGWSITAHTLHGVRQWQATVVSTTSTASHVVDKSGKPALLAAKDVPLAIGILGKALDQVEVATAKAKADNAANNTRIETAQNTVTKDVGDDIDKKLAAARAAGAADYARRVRDASVAAADRGDPGKARSAQAVNTAPGTDGTGGMPLLDEDDVRICSDNTVKALGWQEYDRAIAAIPQ